MSAQTIFNFISANRHEHAITPESRARAMQPNKAYDDLASCTYTRLVGLEHVARTGESARTHTVECSAWNCSYEQCHPLVLRMVGERQWSRSTRGSAGAEAAAVL